MFIGTYPASEARVELDSRTNSHAETIEDQVKRFRQRAAEANMIFAQAEEHFRKRRAHITRVMKELKELGIET